MKLFGFELKRKDNVDNIPSFIEQDANDGALNVNATTGVNGAFGTGLLDTEGSAKSEAQIISKYRQLEQYQEVSRGIDDIVNEAIVIDDKGKVVDINLEDTELSDKIKKDVTEEFEQILNMLDFSNKGYEIFNRWYVDGRIRYHLVIDKNNPKQGIKDLRYIDPRKVRKVKEFEKKKDITTDVILKKVKNEYWVYSEKGFGTTAAPGASFGSDVKGVKVAKDSVIESNSGIMNETNTLILSHLHKSIKPYNQLRMLEDSAVIYRISRAPERRIFYIDVGNLPKMKAEQYLRDMMVKHKNRLIYDASTGDVKDDRRHMTMLEDFWLPRREGGRGTEITTLPGGQNLGEMDDILYFQKNLYKSLNIPVSRMETDAGFSLGRASEITRDEVKFSKFVNRLRARFSTLFDELLERQLILKNVMTVEEWKSIKNKIRYNFQQDNHFEEMKMAEIYRERFQSLNDAESFVGDYYSKEWVRRNILRMSEEDMREMEAQIKKESKEEEENDEDEDSGNDSPDQDNNSKDEEENTSNTDDEDSESENEDK
jgi:hypothetical protein